PGERRPPSALSARLRPPSCTEKRNSNGTSLETNQIFNHSAVIAANAEVAEHDKLVVDLETRSGLLLASSRIDSTHIQIQSVENGTTLRSLPFLKNFSVKLLHEQRGGASSKHVIISGLFLPGRPGCQQRNNFLL